MPRLVHIAAENVSKRIRRNGIAARRWHRTVLGHNRECRSFVSLTGVDIVALGVMLSGEFSQS
jgi:hypothetical protein